MFNTNFLKPIVNVDELDTFQLNRIPSPILINDDSDGETTSTEDTVNMSHENDNGLEIIPVNITVTCEVTVNFYQMSNLTTNEITVTHDFTKKTDSKINDYSKRFVVKIDEDEVPGRIFQNGKIMIYTKKTQIISILQNVLKKLHKSYSDFFMKEIDYPKFNETSCNYMVQFKLPYYLNYMKISSDLVKNKKLISKNKSFVIADIKPRNNFDAGFLFYVNIPKYGKLSFTVYSTGSVQVRGCGEPSYYETITDHCEIMFDYFRNNKHLYFEDPDVFKNIIILKRKRANKERSIRKKK